MKAVFFDRDGVLNQELGRYVCHPDEFEINEWVIPFMVQLQNAGFAFFVITNQGGISKGLYTHTDLFAIHQKLKDRLAQHNIFFKEIFYCPHHPLHSQCLCRKPGNLMLQKAIAKYGVTISQSFMIGDTERDIEAAQKTGLYALQVLPNFPPNASQIEQLAQFTGVPLTV